MAAVSKLEMTTSGPTTICSVCMETYKQPKLLPCCHTFCTPCLKSLANPDEPSTKFRFKPPVSKPTTTFDPSYFLAKLSLFSTGTTAAKPPQETTSGDKLESAGPGQKLKEEERPKTPSTDLDPEETVNEARIEDKEEEPEEEAEQFEEEEEEEEEAAEGKEEKEEDLISPRSFACPTCRHVVTVLPGGVEEFQRNFNMEASIAKASSKDLACELCDNSSPAVQACTECQRLLCLLCVQVHDRVAGAKYHNLVSVDRTGSKATAESTGRQSYCWAHREEPLSVYCRKCKVPICKQCQHSAHKEHDTEDAELALEKLRADLRAALKTLGEEAKVVDEVLADVGKEEQELERQRQAVIAEGVEAAGKVAMWANQAEEKLVTEVDQVTKPAQEKLQREKTLARSSRAEVERLRERAKLVMKNGTHAQLSALKMQVQETLTSLSDRFLLHRSGAQVKHVPLLKRQSAGQEELQITVPRFVGQVKADPKTDQPVPRTAFGFQMLFPVKDTPVVAFHLSGDKMTVFHEGKHQGGLGTKTYMAVTYDSDGRLMERSDVRSFHSQFGKCRASLSSLPSLPVLLCNTSCGLMSGQNWSSLKPGWHTNVSEIALAHGTPRNHAFCLDMVTPGVYEIREISASPEGKMTSKALFQIVGTEDAPSSFDVSADETYFATLTVCEYSKSNFNARTGEAGGTKGKTAETTALKHAYVSKTTCKTLYVSVYRRMEAQPCGTFETTVPVGFSDYGDLCFSRYAGQEMLRVADRQNDCVYVLDHRMDCAEKHSMRVTKPAALASDSKGRVWIACETGSIIVFTP